MDPNLRDTTSQIISHLDVILQENECKAEEKSQAIMFAQTDSVSVFISRFREGSGGKAHFHNSHSETVCILKGAGQILMDGKWVDVTPGSIHFNPPGKVHATRNRSDEPLVYITVLTPAMREPDMQFVE